MAKLLERKLKKQNDKIYIFDPVRKKYVVLTKEESVRQEFIQYLVNDRLYPVVRLAVERMIYYNGLKKRFDLVVFDRLGKPFMLVECKAFDVKINDSTIFQLSTYNKTIQAKILVMTNGISTKAYTFNSNTSMLQSLDVIPKNQGA